MIPLQSLVAHRPSLRLNVVDIPHVPHTRADDSAQLAGFVARLGASGSSRPIVSTTILFTDSHSSVDRPISNQLEHTPRPSKFALIPGGARLIT